MQKCREESEASLLRKFVARLVMFQIQLDYKYKGDGFLIDQLLTAVDIPIIQIALKDRITRKPQHAVHLISNRLSDNPRTAGAECATYNNEYIINRQNDEAHYSLGNTFGGAARKPMKQFRRPFNNQDRNPEGYQGQRKWLNSVWMRGVKGCFACGEQHRARY